MQSLGDGVNQKGSVVDEERLRFDFSHPKPVPADKMADIESECRRQLLAACRCMPRMCGGTMRCTSTVRLGKFTV